MILGYAYVAILLALTVLSLRTLTVLKGSAPWTSAGWILTILYDCTASEEILTATHMRLHLPYVFLATLSIAFAVAGLRDEPQADPWYWPNRLAATRAERARRT